MKLAGFDFNDIRKLSTSDDKENSKRGFLALAVILACVGYLIYSIVNLIIFATGN